MTYEQGRECKVGDKFILKKHKIGLSIGAVVMLSKQDGSKIPFFVIKDNNYEFCINWSILDKYPREVKYVN